MDPRFPSFVFLLFVWRGGGLYKGVELCRVLASGLLLEGLQALIQGSFILVLSHGFGGGVSGVGVVIALGFRTS